MIPLAVLNRGEKAEIVEFLHRGKGMLLRLRDMGLFTGKVVEILSNSAGGPIFLKVDDTRLAIGRGMAMKIMVRRIE